jgi:penicillin amidase
MRVFRSWSWLPFLLLLTACDDGEIAPDASVDDGGGLDAAVDVDAGPVFDPPSHALQAPVEVVRDSLGVVHIYAENDEDLFYASGYMQAVDRLLSMDLARRRALGTRAAVLGPDYVDDDTLVRTVGIERWAKEGARVMREERPEDFALVNAWTAGINARIREVRDGEAPLPHGFGPDELDYLPEEWAVTDGFAVGKLILFGNANQLEFDLLATILRELLPDTFANVPIMQPLTDAFVLPPEERPEGATTMRGTLPRPAGSRPSLPPDAARRLRELFDLVPAPTARFASNNWAVGGEHTDNGRPYVAGDPHQPLRSPMLFWMQHLNSADAGGDFDVAGFSFVGTPAVQLGHNESIAWTATTTYPDISDLWEVRATASSVSIGGEDVPLATREEVIEVRDADPVTITVAEVPGYGVLLPEDIAPIPITQPGRRLLYNWIGFRPTREASSFLAIDRARTLEDFEAAVDSMEIGCFNFIAASADGISYRSSPLVPDRGPGALTRAHWTMLDGDDPESFWSGETLPLEMLPRSRGGERGWLYSANNDPFGFTADGDTAGDPFYFGVFYDPGTRAARIEDELERLVADGAVSRAEMETLQLDAHSVVADELVPILEEVWARVPTEAALAEYRDRPELETLATLIAEWDRSLTRDSAAAVAFDVFTFFVTRAALADDFSVTFDTILGEEPIFMVKWALLALSGAIEGADAVLQEGRDAVVMSALDATATWLESRFGSVDPSGYTWADHHGTLFRAEYPGGPDGGWIPTDGGLGTVNKSPASFLEGGVGVERLESTSGPIYRMVAGFDADGTPTATVTVSRGNAGDPDSPFFDNPTEDWVEGRYQPLRFDRADVEADEAERLELSP